jgi:hypothetical protein
MPSCFRLATDRFAIGYIAGAVALLARFRRWFISTRLATLTSADGEDFVVCVEAHFPR